MAKIKDATVEVLPTGELKEILKLASAGPRWTDARKLAFERLHELIQEKNGLMFSGDFRTYALQTMGSSAVFRVPDNHSGNLVAFRGQLVLVICIGYADKWPSYAGRKYAALQINEAGEILRSVREVGKRNQNGR